MARANAPLLAFNQGEVSKLALARVDLAKMRLAADCQVNWSPWVVGPMSLRPGTIRVGETLNDAAATIIPFIFAKDDTALIEATDSTLRIWINETLLARVAVSTAISDSTFQTGTGWTSSNTTAGCTATIAAGALSLTAAAVGGLAQVQQVVSVGAGDRNKEHGLRVVVTNGPVVLRIGSTAGLSDVLGQTSLDTGTHSLAFTPTTASVTLQIESTDAWAHTLSQCAIEAAGTVTIPTTWTAANLPNLRWDQSGDVVYVACYGQQQRMIQRRGARPGARGWSFVAYRSSNGPFFPSASVVANLTPSVMTGNGTLTSDRPYFDSTHVGALFQLFSNGQTNQATLGAGNAFSPPTRVTGVGTTARNYGWDVSGTYVGSLTLQRSFDGPESGFTDVVTALSGATGNPLTSLNSSTGGTASTPDLDNVIAWERVGFKSGNYTSGSATVSTTSQGGIHKTWNSGGGYGVCRVTSYSSPTLASIEVLEPFSSTNPTQNWVESMWSDYQGWPSSVAFHEGRLWWFGASATAIGSQSNNYTGYASQDSFGDPLGAAGVIIEQLGSGDFDRISWGLSLRGLIMGRERSIAAARSQSVDDTPMTPTAFSVKDCSTNGATRLPAVKLDQRGIYVQQSGRRVYEVAFNPQKFDFGVRDLTRLNLDIGKRGFTWTAVQRQPDTAAHLPRGDGMVAILLDDEDDEVVAWWRFMTLGTVEHVAVLPGSGIEDLVYYVVNRTINGSTRRFIERHALRDDCVGGAANQQADCAYVYSGAPVSSLQVSWLPSTSVIIWADGQPRGTVTSDGSGNVALGGSYSNVVIGLGGQVIIGATTGFLANGQAPDVTFGSASNTLTVGTAYNGYPCEVFADIGGTGASPKHVGALTVSGGVITLPNSQVATTIIACLGYVAPFMSAKLAYGAQLGSALAQKKKIGHIGLVLTDAYYQGLTYGQRFDLLDALPLVEQGATTAAGTVWSEYDEPITELPGEWNTDARLCLMAAAPKPCTVCAVVVDVNTNEK